MIVFINIKQFAIYQGVSEKTASKLYKMYLDLVGKKDFQKLSIYDLAKIDFLEVEQIKNIIKP